ncbi:MAG: isoprenylcysteine carboxylmethyltransferase family protein [Firmicutes bacterium]|nr:isoprenylcysteine carboxylmethyltransferase family protein [Bacillota bacterium]
MSRLILKRFLQIAVIAVMQAAILMAAAGRLAWTWGWAHVALYALTVVVNSLVLLPRHPELIAERAEAKEGTKGWDRVLALLVSLIGPMAIWVVAGLDERFGWTPETSLSARLAGAGLIVAGYGVFSWAMVSNKFFAGVVRIQKERGHQVATAGPYRYLRHPGYVGMVMFTLGAPLLLGSAWAFVPAGATVLLTVLRTALEDATLQRELDGYKDYAARVRYRLLPGVW